MAIMRGTRLLARLRIGVRHLTERLRARQVRLSHLGLVVDGPSIVGIWAKFPSEGFDAFLFRAKASQTPILSAYAGRSMGARKSRRHASRAVMVIEAGSLPINPGVGPSAWTGFHRFGLVKGEHPESGLVGTVRNAIRAADDGRMSRLRSGASVARAVRLAIGPVLTAYAATLADAMRSGEVVARSFDMAKVEVFNGFWPGIDPAGGSGGVLGRAMRAYPSFGDILTGTWGAALRNGWSGDGAGDAGEAALAWTLAAFGMRQAAAVGKARHILGNEALLAMAMSRADPDRRFERRGDIHMLRDEGRLDGRSLALAAHVPKDWLPKDAEEASAFVSLARLVDLHGIHLDVPVAFNSKGRWAEFAERCLSAAAVERDPALEARVLSNKVRDLGDVVRGFSSDVLRPGFRRVLPELAERLAAGPQRLVLQRAIDALAWDELFGGKTLPRMLEASYEWHRRPKGSVGSYSWKAGLPDWRHGEVDLVVLTDSVALADEGARGEDANGNAGLRHCVGTYSKKCQCGSTRIVSLRKGSATTFERLSTANVSIGIADGKRSYYLVEHRGLSNGIPCDEAERALDAYLGRLRNGTLKGDFDGLTIHSRFFDDCDYDWTVPGAVEHALRQWSPMLPRPRRELTVVEWAAMVKERVERSLRDG